MAPSDLTPASKATLTAEWMLLLAACSAQSEEEKRNRLRALLQKTISWKSALDLADRHGVLSFLYQAVCGGEYEVPAETLGALKDRYRINLHKNLILARELIRVLDRLEQMGIAVLPYKGLTLAEQIYGDIALRQSGDMDLLIRPKDFSRIKEAVRDLGYTPHDQLSEAEERAYLSSGYECAFDSSAGRNLLEVQWAIQPRFYAVDMNMDEVFRRAVSVTVASHPLKTPSPEDQILILSVHAAKHAWGRLIWLCDIARIAQLPNLNWKWIEEEAANLGIARILSITLLLTKRLLGASVPKSLETQFAADAQARNLADEVTAQIVSGKSADVESLAYFRLMLRIRERKSDRMRFVQRLVFTPGPGEWKAVRLPASLFPLYRLVRLSRLAARLVRA